MDKLNGSIRSKGTISGGVRSRGSISGDVRVYQKLVHDYNDLENKPSIEDVTLIGNKVMSDFGDRTISNFEIKDIINRAFNRSGGH